MKLNVELVLLLLLFFGLSLCEMVNISNKDDLDLERHVSAMNKPSIKTFMTKEGEIIDCVDINKQLAFDHPLLKNHKVQTEPNLHVTRLRKTSPNAKLVRSGLREPCPIGTVPIRRVTKEDLVSARSLQKIPSVAAMRHCTLSSNQHVVSLTDNMVENVKYGGGGRLTVYNLTIGAGGVQPSGGMRRGGDGAGGLGLGGSGDLQSFPIAYDHFSAHNMWIESGPPDHISMIAAGWMVSPHLFGDTLSRLFTYWTGDGYRNGCYNVLCPGFVQVSREVTPGFPLQPTSTYGGDQYELAIDIEQDRSTGNWWLVVLRASIKVGYWPKELFLHLRDGSLHTAWGGIGLAGSDGICPPMGSGHMPDGNFKHAAIFRRLHWVRSDGKSLPPSDNTTEWVDRSNVYGLVNHHYVKKYRSGYTISFGGPGGYCRG
ncbi:uncharacterized protein LOC115754953 [Rhodamnia argentea]|uniref:Uncharacterized protein LOC115754953 n=1 Tax=Rhodamnia argentea TaxID=178133 RepID=A0ABM3HBR6_9MYRT|nr:uncharacterized protein LOC115754953 [Rhodamnia argentea]